MGSYGAWYGEDTRWIYEVNRASKDGILVKGRGSKEKGYPKIAWGSRGTRGEYSGVFGSLKLPMPLGPHSLRIVTIFPKLV